MTTSPMTTTPTSPRPRPSRVPLSPSNIQVRAGSHSLEALTGQEQYAFATEVVVHPGFSDQDGEGSYADDLMLLRIQPALTVTPFVQPLTLPSAPPAPGTNCTVMGWGTTTSPEGMGHPGGEAGGRAE
uniref:Peptidase S1 domain-containing protein n=1 Tax=Cairina moschata TaxID=8855 RepID=A0A8C3GKW5_CAIMO